jgi:hypothetical protein
MTEKRLNLYELAHVLRPLPPSQWKTSLWAHSPDEARALFLSTRVEEFRDRYRIVSCTHCADVQKLYEEKHGETYD